MDDLKWYDSRWLAAYYAAKDHVAKFAPQRLDEFIHGFDVLRTRPDFKARILPDLLTADQLETLRESIRSIPQDRFEFNELKRFGRLMTQDWPEFTRLQHSLTDRVSEWAGEAVEPCYNFLSLYTRLGVCEPHLDTPAAKWTLDLCINQSEPWPIHFSQIIPWPEQRPDLPEDWHDLIKQDSGLSFNSLAMTPGDAILFSGSSQWHYRDAMPQDGRKHFCDLLFLHYVPAGAGELVEARNWARYFDIPEIADIPGIELAW